MKTTAIIVAAGSGSRFNSDTPKQFLEIGGKAVIEHTIRRFVDSPSVDEIVLVLSDDRIAGFDRSKFAKVTAVVAGGNTRAESVANGIAAVSYDCGLIAVHDGARPLVSIDEIERTIDAAKACGAACLVAPVTDTIKLIQKNEVMATLDRTKLRRALTPQVFEKELLLKAFEGVYFDESITDECYLVEKLGHQIAIVEGSPRNIKITHREDLTLAEAFLREDV